MGLRSHNDEDHRVILTRFLAELVKEDNGGRIDDGLLGWLRKHLEAADTDLLREMVLGFVQALIGAEADALCGAGFGERSPDRVNQRNGYRERRLDTRVGTLELARSAKIAAAPSGGEAEPSALSSARGTNRAMSPKRDQPAAGSRPIGVGVVTGPGDRDGNNSKEVAMRPIRTIAPLALGLVALAVAGCQSRPDQPPTPTPTPIEQAAPATTAPAGQARPPSRPPVSTTPKPKPVPGPETVVGRWPAQTLGYARTLQDSADAGRRPWLLSRSRSPSRSPGPRCTSSTR